MKRPAVKPVRSKSLDTFEAPEGKPNRVEERRAFFAATMGPIE